MAERPTTVDHNKKVWAVQELLNPVLLSYLLTHGSDGFMLQRGRWEVIKVFKGGHKYAGDEPGGTCGSNLEWARR